MVSSSQVAMMSTLVSSHLKKSWPRMRQAALTSLKPVIHHEVDRMVAEITVDVGGMRVRLPDALQAEIAQDINRLLAKNLNAYFQHQFNPAMIVTPQLVRQALNQPLTVHLWVRAWRVPVPVTIVLPGTS